MKVLNVLSIDFDYFEVVDAETVCTYFPDGHDYNTKFSEMIWQRRYCENSASNTAINSVKANKTELGILKSLLRKQNPALPVTVCNSHKYIYDEMQLMYKRDKYDAINVVNIDMHHDIFNNNAEIDCGNWVSHIPDISKNYTITWVANPISREVYGLTDDKFNAILNSINDVQTEHFDFVFLCRSDIWTPPHLDREFDKLFTTIINHFKSVSYEGSVSFPRNVDTKTVIDFEKELEKLKKLQEKNNHS